VTPEEVQSLRELAAEVVATWPPLSEDQRARLAVLLRPPLAPSSDSRTDKAA
jgi:hypothetical protein